MATVTLCDENRTIRDADEIKQHLANIGIDYERWTPSQPVNPDQSAEEILAAYRDEIEKLKARGGYVTADVIDVTPLTVGLDEMLARFNREHWHDEDEVRFIITGRGLFHIRPDSGPVTAIEVEAGDLIRVPRATNHWFNLCSDRRIRAIRLFQDPAGWAPQYTGSGFERGYQPLCMGNIYFPREISQQAR
jgi:1,2-dihydroxy-3-keto-5-methylthiopentene dioxygenase